eukprot:TRINITY_DN49597_c0_g1_i2.p2 TRINITY_DN49597_c0_g1~~TRINITY_DN49597_c0_g1_i2.p2  ORF type:complete len:191 (+),score=39.71 TRINITY_DN49597_c0_g1_i2:61-633(+)
MLRLQSSAALAAFALQVPITAADYSWSHYRGALPQKAVVAAVTRFGQQLVCRNRAALDVCVGPEHVGKVSSKDNPEYCQIFGCGQTFFTTDFEVLVSDEDLLWVPIRGETAPKGAIQSGSGEDAHFVCRVIDHGAGKASVKKTRGSLACELPSASPAVYVDDYGDSHRFAFLVPAAKVDRRERERFRERQ